MTPPARMRVLGPIELVRPEGPVRLGGPKQQAVLALLVAARGEVRSRSAIIMGVWGADASDAHQGSFHTYVSNLRALLGGVIERRGEGYRVDTDAVDVDAWTFEDAVERARRLIATSPAEAATSLRAALASWRGPAYLEASEAEGLQAEITRLEDLRLDAVELRIDADLALGRHSKVTAELEALTLEHPLRERFRTQHMLALYRSGRQAEALRAYQRARTFLAEELGLEPSPELVELEMRILQQDPALLVSDGQATTQRLAFLFTGIEDPASLWELHPADMSAALEHHDGILTEAVERRAGMVIRQTGEGIISAFPDVPSAIAAAEAGQRELAGAKWDPLPALRVRMAIDVGDIDIRDGAYVGPPLNRCARILAVAHGGQVLVSGTAMDETARAGAEGVQIRQLGEHRFRGLATPERIGQLVIDGLPGEFPALRSHVSSVRVDELEPGMALPGYELRDPVGRGTFGLVYRAYQPSVNREVAVKVIRPEYASHPAFVRRFEAEARLFASLQHPHLVPLFDYWRDPGGAYLVMRLLEGGDLTHAMDGQAVDSERAAKILHQLAAAVAYMHAKGIVHRDIKPGNVLLDGLGNAYLGDFGIAGRLLQPVGEGELPTSSPGYRAPEDRAGSPTDRRSDVFSLGVLAHELLAGYPPADDGGLSADAHLAEPLETVIATATAERPEARFQTVEDLIGALDAAFDDVDTERLLVVKTELRNPYKGLASFAESDAGDFFGRDAGAESVVDAVQRHPFVTVVGPSGSGKSSVVLAGSLPRLRAGVLDGSGDWFITDLTPGPDPLAALAEAIEAVADVAVADAVGMLSAGGDGLIGLLSASVSHPDSTILLVIDQLEELYTQADATDRATFIAVIHQAVDAGAVRVLATLRADFYDRPLDDAALAPLVRDGLVSIIPPTPDELIDAIERPAARIGVTFEPGLPDRIAREVHDRPGALPLLQFALTQMFEARTSDRINGADYEALGGVFGVLGRQAEAAHMTLSAAHRAVAEVVMLRLVSVEEDAEVTRRRVRRAELESLSLDRAQLATVLETYGSARLLAFDRDPISRGATVQIAHETLLDAWPRLSGWIAQRRESLVLTRRLRAAMDEWDRSGRADDFLLRGARLSRFAELEGAGTLTGAERAFLQASHDAEQRTREDAQRRRVRRRLAAVAGIAASFAAVSAVVLAVGQTLQAEQEAEREALINRVFQEADTRGDVALLLAVEAYRRDPGPAGQSALLAALRATNAERTLDDGVHEGPATPDLCGASIPSTGVFVSVGGDEDGMAELVDHDVLAGEVLRFSTPLRCSARRLSDGRYIGSTDGPSDLGARTTTLFDPETGEVVPFSADLTRFLDELPDGRLLFEHDDDPGDDETGSIVIVDPATGRIVADTGVRSLEATIDPTGRYAATQDFRPGAPIRGILEVETLEVAELEEQIEAPSWWAPDGSELLTFDGQRVVRFDPSGAVIGETTVATPNGATVQDIAFAPSGRLFAAVVPTGITVFSYPDLQLVAGPVDIPPRTDAVSMVDDRTVAVHDRSGLVRLIRTTGGSPIERRTPFGRFDDSLFMLSGEYGLVWTAEGPEYPVRLGTWETITHGPDLVLGSDRFIAAELDAGGLTISVHDVDGTQLATIRPPGAEHDDFLWQPTSDGAVALLALSSEDGQTENAMTMRMDATTLQVDYSTPIDMTGASDLFGWNESAFWMGSGDGGLTIRDWSGAVIGSWGPVEDIEASTISPDGSRFAAVANDGVVTIYESATGAAISELDASALGEPPIFIDERRLMVRDDDGRVVLWDVETSDELGMLASAPESRPHEEFGTSGYTPVRSSDRRSVWFTQPGVFVNVDVEPAAWVDAACEAAGRTLTPEEWELLVPGDEPYRDPCEPAFNGL